MIELTVFRKDGSLNLKGLLRWYDREFKAIICATKECVQAQFIYELARVRDKSESALDTFVRVGKLNLDIEIDRFLIKISETFGENAMEHETLSNALGKYHQLKHDSFHLKHPALLDYSGQLAALARLRKGPDVNLKLTFDSTLTSKDHQYLQQVLGAIYSKVMEICFMKTGQISLSGYGNSEVKWTRLEPELAKNFLKLSVLEGGAKGKMGGKYAIHEITGYELPITLMWKWYLNNKPLKGKSYRSNIDEMFADIEAEMGASARAHMIKDLRELQKQIREFLLAHPIFKIILYCEGEKRKHRPLFSEIHYN